MKVVSLYKVEKSEVGTILAGLSEEVVSSEQNKFKRCGDYDSRRLGFSPNIDGLFVTEQGAYTQFTITEQFKVPEPLAVQDLLDLKIFAYKEANEGNKPNNKELKELKLEVVETLLPSTYPKPTKSYKVIILNDGTIMVEATGKKAEELLGKIRMVVGSLPVKFLESETPIGDLLDKLISTQKDDKFELLNKATLIDQDGQQASLSKDSLYDSIAQDLIKEGAYATSVELFFDGAVAFDLKDDFTLKGIKFSDVVEAEDDEQATEFLQISELIKVVNYILDSTKLKEK